jgi:hypothetical protein
MLPTANADQPRSHSPQASAAQRDRRGNSAGDAMPHAKAATSCHTSSSTHQAMSSTDFISSMLTFRTLLVSAYASACHGLESIGVSRHAMPPEGHACEGVRKQKRIGLHPVASRC